MIPRTNVHVEEMIGCPLPQPEPCQGCGEEAWIAYKVGVYHHCCLSWKFELDQGRACMGCGASRAGHGGRAPLEPVDYEIAPKPAGPPTYFCATPDCYLTTGVQGEHCWVHRATQPGNEWFGADAPAPKRKGKRR